MDISCLLNTNLFKGLTESEISTLLTCLKAYQKNYKKGDIIFHSGDVINEIGFILEGSVNIVVNLYTGQSNIFSHISKGFIFGEAYAVLQNRELICDVVSSDNTEVLFLNLKSLLSPCSKACGFHQKIITNLVHIQAKKNISLSTRMIHTSSKSLRDRLLSYLSEQALLAQSNYFTIPFSRYELSAYLGVDRSALSNELSKMQKDGLIQYHLNDFKLLVK